VVTGLGIDGRHPRYDETHQAGGRVPIQRSLDATRPGDITPRIMRATGGVSHAGPGDHSSLIRNYEKGNGARPQPPPALGTRDTAWFTAAPSGGQANQPTAKLLGWKQRIAVGEQPLAVGGPGLLATR
jgi:hypothetical protein